MDGPVTGLVGARRHTPGMRGGLSVTYDEPAQPEVVATFGAGPLERWQSTPLLKLAVFLCVLLVGRLHDLHPIGQQIPVAKVLLPIGVLLLITDRNALQRLAVFSTVQGGAFIALFVAIALSVPTSILRSAALQRFIDMVLGTLPYVLIIATAARSPADLKRLMRALILAVVIIALALVAGLGATIDSRRSVSFMYDPNDLAQVAVVVLPLAFLTLRDRSIRWKLLAVGACAATPAILGMTASRGGLLGFGAIILAVLLRRTKAVRLKLVVIAALVGGLTLIPATLWERLSDLTSRTDYNFTSESGRIEVWKRGAQVFASRPITGVGVYQYWVADGKFPGRGRQDLSWHTAHNSILQVGAELGIVGLVPWLLLFIPTVSSARRARRLYRTGLIDASYVEVGDALILSLLGFAVTGMFLSSGYGMIAMTLVAVGMAYSCMLRRAEAAGRSVAGLVGAPSHGSERGGLALGASGTTS